MDLPPDVLERLAKEYRFVATKMPEESEPIRVVYFFSALFTEISRILNWHWDRDLVLLHWVLQGTHSQLSARAQPSSPGSNLQLTSMFIEPLRKIAEELADYMEQGGQGPQLYEILGRIAEIGYLSTPHGSYVMEKELADLDSI